MTRHPQHPGLLAVAAAALVLAAGGAQWAASQDGPSEYEVKAAFLYNFAKYVDWPPAAFTATSTPIVIGVLGDDPFGEALDRTVRGRTAGGRALEVRRPRDAVEALGCHILFVAASEEPRLDGILAAVREGSVLTVGDMPRFSERGGAIGFVMAGRRVRFEVDRAAAEGVGLRISSHLLKLAAVVRGPGERRGP